MIASLADEPITVPPAPAPARVGSARVEPAAPVEEIPPDDEIFLFPATAAQQRFWLLDQLVPGGNPALNTAIAVSLRGSLDQPALARAFDALAARHEALRTTFQYEGGELCQIIAPELTLHVGLVDVRDFPETERPGVPSHLAAEEAARPFDLARGPLCRALLVRLSPVEHSLLFTLHHIICDGWSNGILLRELAALYEAFSQGKPSPLPPLPLQFADFAQWQRDRAAASGFDADLAYWRGKLAGSLPLLDLPADHPRAAATPRARVAAAGTCWRRLPDALAASLKTLAVREGASGYMLYLAAFTVLLARYDARGGEDILVGTPSANRGRAEIEGLVGLFVNPLLLRADLSGDPTFRELLGRVRQTVLGAFEHAEAPFERLIEELQSRRFQVNFLYASAFLQPVRLPDLELLPQDPASGGAMYEWDASVIEDRQGVRLSIEYNADRFDAATVDRVLADYEALLAGVAAPDGMETPVRRLPLASASDASAGTRLIATRARLPQASAGWVERFLEWTSNGDGTEPARTRPGVALRVVDRHGENAPVGVPGEIFVGAPGQAAEPFRTGDLGVRAADGRVAWLGRLDAQTHAGGQRVDTRAVETALRTHPHVREALVHRSADRSRESLTAWFQSDGAPAALVSPEQLRAFLREHVPEEWLPTAFARVERFPMTAGGYLDEARLPTPAPTFPAGPTAGEGDPYLTIHFQLIDLWQELLNVPRVGIHDDFFALGGNSLLAMRMLHRAEELCGRKLLPSMLFRQATVEGLADAILQRGGDGPPPELIAIQEKGSRTPIFYLHGDMTGGGYYCMKLSRRLGPDQPFYAIPPADVPDWRKLPSVEALAERHLRAIRAVRPHGPYIVGGFCLGGLIAHAIARQLAAEGETVERLLLIDATARNRRLKTLRRMAERLGRQRGWDSARQLYQFCRWHFLVERFNRWREMGVGGQFSILRRRTAGVARRVFGRFLPGPAVEPVAGGVIDFAPRDRGGSGKDGSWFDPRWDVPLVFLWAEGGYEVKTFDGPATLLLSHDLTGPDAEEPVVREWTRHLPRLDTRELSGSHLATITEHVDGLAETIREVLAKPPGAA